MSIIKPLESRLFSFLSIDEKNRLAGVYDERTLGGGIRITFQKDWRSKDGKCFIIAENIPEAYREIKEAICIKKSIG